MQNFSKGSTTVSHPNLIQKSKVTNHQPKQKKNFNNDKVHADSKLNFIYIKNVNLKLKKDQIKPLRLIPNPTTAKINQKK